MTYWEMKKVRESQPPLSPPMTPEEERWWAKERKKHYRGMMVRFGLPMFLISVVSAGIAEPEGLHLFIPVFAVMMFGMSWVQARFQERRQRQQEVRWKRIRESLLANPHSENP